MVRLGRRTVLLVEDEEAITTPLAEALGREGFDTVVAATAAAALAQAAAVDREALLDALNEVTVSGANGDERGFNLHNHEGVVDDDVYFARFEDMTFAPVDDDPLSSTLPEISQVR